MNDGQGTARGGYWRVWIGVGVVFLCGLLVGIAATTVYHDYQRQQKWERGLAGMKPRVIHHLTRELRLSTDQQRASESLVVQAEKELLQLRMSQQPHVEEIIARTIQSLKTHLSAEQQQKLDELYGKLRRRWESDREYVRGLQP